MKSKLKRLLPQQAKKILRHGIDVCSKYFLVLFQHHGILSSLYYALFSRKFEQEHKAVLLGRKAYREKLIKIGDSCVLLRRNIHRLEKGLIMRPRREVFAEGYIYETVNCYKDAVESPQLAINEKKWATDVLDEYFKVVGSSTLTDKAREIYRFTYKNLLDGQDTASSFLPQLSSFKPYSYEQLPKNDISFEQIRRLFIRRRSVRWYQNKHVPIKLVQRAANIASFAPSACNRQPYRFLFCNNKKKAVAIANSAGGTVGFAENLPAIIAVVGDLSAFPYERDRHLIYIDGSLAVMQLMLALETLGLSTCSINWPEVDANERKIRSLIELEDYERVVMLLAVGYADTDGGIPYSQKKENHLILENIS